MISNGCSDLGRRWTALFVLISIGFVAGCFLFCGSEMNYIWQQKSLEIKTCPGNPKDKIAVVLPARGEEAALSVSDTDTGFPESVDFGTTGLPGSPLIVQLVKQAGGYPLERLFVTAPPRSQPFQWWRDASYSVRRCP